MTTFALVHFPSIDKTRINELRDEYDPYRDLIDVHITVVFPVQVERQTLIDHIEHVLQVWSPFTVHFNGLILSFDQWLFLTVQEGDGQLVKLFEEMYTGLLAPHRRHDLEYVSRIGLGYFGTQKYDPHDPSPVPLDEGRYEEALRRAEAANLDYEVLVDRLSLIEVDDGFSGTSLIKEFSL